MVRAVTLAVVSFALALSCESSPSAPDTATAESLDGDTQGDEAPSTVSDDVTAGEASTEAEVSTEAGATDDGLRLDQPTDDLPCDPFDPFACDEGRKCRPWLQDDVHSFRCLTMPSDLALGEMCEQTPGPDPVGTDACAVGSLCVEADFDMTQGWCAAFCDAAHPCEPGERCIADPRGDFSTCRPECDPLEPSPCPTATTSCVLHSNPGFVCHGQRAGQAGQGEMCTASSDCDAAHLCLSGAVVGPSVCGQHAGCCAQLCDVFAPNCDPALTCVDVFMPGQAPGFDHVGFCQGG